MLAELLPFALLVLAVLVWPWKIAAGVIWMIASLRKVRYQEATAGRLARTSMGPFSVMVLPWTVLAAFHLRNYNGSCSTAGFKRVRARDCDLFEYLNTNVFHPLPWIESIVFLAILLYFLAKLVNSHGYTTDVS
ncbi:hypothetical protein [Chelatococcus reniformis]|uniref:Uncharacterized protein n=1 Tax=Chelatococcus reniformis TaxID=1494448 RepID=A0A916UXT5_9HYPH|nr:hypothetical protein [Chelatococcus reniformis]GGC93617.1 hypothetical protein GCM10010994_59270 [Chelatococcus reniformis]